MITRRTYRWLTILAALLVLLVAAVSGQAQQAKPAEDEAASAEKPEVLVEEPFRHWTVGGDFIYWADRCSGGPDRGPAGTAPEAAEADYSLRRLPTGRGWPRTLVTVSTPNCQSFLNMVADGSGVYYFNQSLGRIEMVPVDAGPVVTPTIIQTQVSDVEAGMVLDEEFVYYANQDDEIIRLAKDGSGASTILTAATRIKDLAVDDATVYWVDSDGLWWGPKDCTSLPCDATRLSSDSGERLTLEGSGLGGQPAAVFLVQSGATWRILRLACAIQLGGPPTCGLSDLYDGPAGAAIGELSRVVTGGFINRKVWLYWTELSSAGGRLMRLLVTGEDDDLAEELYPGNPTLSFKNFTDTDYVYFADQQTGKEQIMRLPLAADPLLRDLAFAQWEVTQGVQNLVHDVTLVANKTTFVRVFGQQLSGGQRATTVEAALRGYRGAQELPGSPLAPVKNVTQSLRANEAYMRQDADEGWLFRLPQSWTDAGTLTLQVEVDPRELYADSNRDNNWNQGPVTFRPSRRACAVFIPILTDDPLPQAIGNPHFPPMVDQVKNLWPIAGIMSFQQSPPLTEGGGPFEMEDDYSKVLAAVEQRWLMSDPPAACPENARYFAVGMVHPYATGPYRGLGAGPASAPHVASWVQIPDPDRYYNPQDVNYPAALIVGANPGKISYGTILAHELGHNAGRQHIDCGLRQGAEFDTQWPYPGFECQLDDHDAASPNSHYGFHARLRQPIPGDEAADIMTYEDDTTWISGYTSNALYEALCADSQDCPATQASLQHQPSLAAAQDTMLVSGLVYVGSGEGELDKVWTFPARSVSAAVAGRWQALSAARPAQPESASALDVSLQLLAADGSLVASHQVILDTVSDEPAGSEYQTFLMPLAVPEGAVTTIELWVDGELADTLAPGNQAPQVILSRPAAGQAVGDSLTVLWSVSDPDGDPVEFVIQYSPDQASWFTVAGPLPAGSGPLSAHLDLSGVPGSSENQARLRIVATDGLHTTLATSPAFTVADHAPQVLSAAPAPGQQFAAGQPIVFSGEALDPEDGPLPADALSWQVNGRELAAGANLDLDGLAPGEYEAILIGEDSIGNKSQAQVHFSVAPLTIPEGTRPTLDGYCDDAGYSGSAQVPLAPYADGHKAIVRLQREGNYVWICFSGLQRSIGSMPGRASLRLDADHSRHDLAQTDDFVFSVSEDGTPEILVGDLAGGLQDQGAEGMVARVSASEGAWQAEVRLPLDFFQGWNHVVGLALAHEMPGAGDHLWPNRADEGGLVAPSSWATAALGNRPLLSAATPEAAQAGDPGFTLTLSGQGFVEGSQVLWNDKPLETEFIDEGTLQAQVDSSELAQAGVVFLRVANPGFVRAPSGSLPFEVENPLPVLDSLSPQTAVAGSASLTLRARGSNFLPGAQLVWNGRLLTTQIVNSGELRAQLLAEDLGMPGRIGVLVYNPAPGGGSSAVQEFLVQPAGDDGGDQVIFLPLIAR